MPASQAEGAFGVKLRRNGVEIAEIVDVTPPELTRATYEKTHHGSPNRWKEFGKGLKDGGEVSFTINFLLTNPTHNAAQGVLADYNNDLGTDTWDFVFPNAASTVWSFPGILTSFKPSTPINEQIKADVTIKVAGQPTLA